MRSYSSLLVFENVFDSTSTTDSVIADLCQRLFYPQVEIVEDYCHTLLGEEKEVNYELEGYIELSTGEQITRARIEELLSQGTYVVRVRSLSTCSSEGGVCAKCYHSSRPDEAYPDVGSFVTVAPLFVKSSEVLVTDASNSVALTLDQDSYDSVLVYGANTLQPSSSYQISGTTLTFTSGPVTPNTAVVVRYRSDTKAPFMLWLADTYSGSLLGVKALPGPLLPLPSLQLRSLIPEHQVDALVEALSSSSSRAPENLVEYARGTPDLLEKALFCIALRTIYDAS